MEKEYVDRRRGGKTISKGGQGWSLPAQLKAGQARKGLLRSHLCSPTIRTGYGIDLTRYPPNLHIYMYTIFR